MHDKLASLNEQLQHLPEPAIRWEKDDGTTFATGQVWTVNGGCGDQPTWVWVILECLEDGLVNVAPMFLWGELAGSEDVYVPREWAGVTVIVSFELECTLDRSACAECHGRLPAEALDYLLTARADTDEPSRRHAHTWGMGYLDEHDLRLAYHEAIVETIERLQAPVRDNVFSEEDVADPIPFPWPLLALRLASFPAAPLAADTGEKSSRCILTTAPEPHADEIREGESPEKLWIRCTDFEPLRPCTQEGPVLEWLLERALPETAQAFVYDAGHELCLGEAVLGHEPDGTTLVTLPRPDVAGLPEVIERAEQLVVLIVVPEQE